MIVHNIGSNRTLCTLPDGKLVMVSYSEPVLIFAPGFGALRRDRFFSVTTSRHISKTLDEWGCDACLVSEEEFLRELELTGMESPTK